MSLTSAELDQARRFCGYPVASALSASDAVTQASSAALDATLAGLTDDQITTVRTVYLANLTVLESALPATGEGLDVSKAAVYTRNQAEQAERETLFASTRLKLCFYLGVPAGPAILATVLTGFAGGGGSGSMTGGAFVPTAFVV